MRDKLPPHYTEEATHGALLCWTAATSGRISCILESVQEGGLRALQHTFEGSVLLAVCLQMVLCWLEDVSCSHARAERVQTPRVAVRVLPTTGWMPISSRPLGLLAGERERTELAEKCHVQFNLCQFPALSTEFQGASTGVREK